MGPGHAVLLVVSLLTAANWAVHYYTQTVTYPLFPVVAAQTDGGGFVRYHRAYERKLPIAVYLPWTALTAVSALFVVIRPPGLSVGWPLTLLVLNASIAAFSLLLAAPVHRRVDAAGSLDAGHARMLLRYNGIRLTVATTSLLIVTALDWHHLVGAA